MKKPFAYISAARSGQEFTDTDQAVVYCRKVYQAGFICTCWNAGRSSMRRSHQRTNQTTVLWRRVI